MSLINQINAATAYFWENTEPQDIVNKSSALLWKLMGNATVNGDWLIKSHEIVDGGLMIKVPLEYDVSNHGSYGKDTVIDQSKKTILDAARFRWAGAYGSNTLNLDDLTANNGEEAIVDLTETYVNAIIKAIRVDLASQIVASAADSDSILGLEDLFNTTTSTEYGSIAEDDMSAWKANVIDTSEQISFKVMQTIFRKPGFGGYKGTRPNFCVTTETLADGYERSLFAQQRYQDDKMVEAGWDNILHKGAPIVADPYVASGVLYALNLNFLKLRTHTMYNFTTPEWVAKREGGQPDTLTANTRWRGQLVCTNRQMHVKHSNLSEPT